MRCTKEAARQPIDRHLEFFLISRNHIVVVTRWFGGKHLGGDRFRHLQEAVRTYIKAL